MGIFSKLFNFGVKTENSKLSNEMYMYNKNQGNFNMVVEDIFTIIGHGIVVTGKIESGGIDVGDTITINNNINAKVVGIELFRKKMDHAEAGENVGLLLEGVDKSMINKNDIITK